MTFLPYPTSLPYQAIRASARMAILTVFLAWAGGMGAGFLGAQEAAPSWEPNGAQLEEVMEALGTRWGVTPESLVLEWGVPRGGAISGDLTEVELIGHGKGGRWVVSFRSVAGGHDAQSVLLRAGVRVSVPVAARSLERGIRIQEEDLEYDTRVHWGAPSDLADPCQVGWVTQRRIDNGEILSTPGVRPPLMVVSGRAVRALWSNGRVFLTLNATAVGSGSLGDRVFVRTEEGTRLDGIVQGPGEVLISSSWMESWR